VRPSAKIAQGYETYRFLLNDGRVVIGFVVSEGADAVQARDGTGMPQELQRSAIASREQQTQSAMPEGLANNLTPEQLADLVAYLRSLE
jgi:putative heme-binding domain-containing protein